MTPEEYMGDIIADFNKRRGLKLKVWNQGKSC